MALNMGYFLLEVILTQRTYLLVNAAGSSSVHPIVSLKAKASSGSNIDYNTTPKSIEKIEFWSKYRQDLTFF
jgi:hypothetical protein